MKQDKRRCTKNELRSVTVDNEYCTDNTNASTWIVEFHSSLRDLANVKTIDQFTYLSFTVIRFALVYCHGDLGLCFLSFYLLISLLTNLQNIFLSKGIRCRLWGASSGKSPRKRGNRSRNFSVDIALILTPGLSLVSEKIKLNFSLLIDSRCAVVLVKKIVSSFANLEYGPISKHCDEYGWLRVCQKINQYMVMNNHLSRTETELD